jgi:serine/threonine protein kinase
MVCAAKCAQENDKDAFENVRSESFIFCKIREWSKEIYYDGWYPNIIRYIGTKIDEERPVLMMEYCPNGNLFDYITQNRSKCGKRTWIHWCKQLANVVQFLHRGGVDGESGSRQAIIHNDIKPHNVLLDEHLDLKLCDFGGSVLVPVDPNDSFALTVKDGLGLGTQGKPHIPPFL